MNLEVTVEGFEHLENLSDFSKFMDGYIPRLSQETKTFWETIAGQRLKSSRMAYQQAIKLESIDSNSFTIVLDGGFVPYAIEVGTPPYTMNVPHGKIVPLNVDREIIFTSPQVWRTGTGEPWNHPGFQGFNMLKDVVEEVIEKVDRHITESLSKI